MSEAGQQQKSKLSPNPLHTATAEEVRHGNATEGVQDGVKCVWNAITADKYSFFLVLGTLYFHFSLAPVLWILSKYKVQTKSKHSASILSKGLTRGHCVCLTCQSMHFAPQKSKQ